MFDYTIRRSEKARVVRISIRNGKVVLVLPKRISECFGKEFLKKNSAWVLKKLKEQVPKFPSSNFLDGDILFFLGRKFYTVKTQPTSRKKAFFREHFNELHCFIPPKITESSQKSETLKHLVENFYREKAKKHLLNRVCYFADKLGVEFNKVFIKDNQTRWGSCSSKKNLNFNWRIMMFAREIVDYLVIHEVCHLREMNHSPAFWKLVERFDSEFSEHRKILGKSSESY